MCKMYAEPMSNSTNKTLNNNQSAWWKRKHIQKYRPYSSSSVFFIDVTSRKANANCNSSMTICIICIRRVLKIYGVKVLKFVPGHFQYRSEVFLLGKVEVITHSIIHTTWDFNKQVGHHGGQLPWAGGCPVLTSDTHTLRKMFPLLAWP